MKTPRRPDPNAGLKFFFGFMAAMTVFVLIILQLSGVEVVRFPEPMSAEDHARGYR